MMDMDADYSGVNAKEEKELASASSLASITSVVPFSSIGMVVVVAFLRPNQFQEMLELGQEKLGIVNKYALIGQLPK
jgi:hypothetical protein